VAGGFGLGEQLAEDEVQDAAVAEVVDLVEGVDPAKQRDVPRWSRRARFLPDPKRMRLSRRATD
jgi:hypothetical protein